MESRIQQVPRGLISYYLANGVVYTVEDIRAPGWDQESGYGVIRIDIVLWIQS